MTRHHGTCGCCHCYCRARVGVAGTVLGGMSAGAPKRPTESGPTPPRLPGWVGEIEGAVWCGEGEGVVGVAGDGPAVVDHFVVFAAFRASTPRIRGCERRRFPRRSPERAGQKHPRVETAPTHRPETVRTDHCCHPLTPRIDKQSPCSIGVVTVAWLARYRPA